MIVEYDYVKERWDFRVANRVFPSRDLARAHECGVAFLAEQLWLEQQQEPEFEPDQEFIEEKVDEFEQMRQIERYIAARRAAQLRDQIEAEAWAALIVAVLTSGFSKEPSDLTQRLQNLLERSFRDERTNAKTADLASTLRP